MFEFQEVTAPYPGLRPFEPYEGEIFFGREGHTDRLLEILQQQGFLAVIGPSGGGKSSLVRAGLLPALAAGRLGTGSHWRLALLRPGSQPLLALAQALIAPHALGPELLIPDSDNPASGGCAALIHPTTPHNTNAAQHSEAVGGISRRRIHQSTLLPTTVDDATVDAALIAAELRQGPDGLARLLAQAQARRVAQAGGKALPPLNLLILADQFEEVFTYQGAAPDQNEAAAFVDLLLAARDLGKQATADGIRPVVALTMRTDFLGECVQFPELPEAINRAQYLTPRLKAEELRAAILGPARLFDGDVDASFIDAVIKEIHGDSDQLPQLQHALARWWQAACQQDTIQPQLCAALSDQAGDVSHALEQHAEQLYAALPREQQQACEWLFRAICEGREGAAAVRRPQKLADIAHWSGQPLAELKTVVAQLAAPEVSFLHYGRQLTEQSVIDLTHEALMRQWQRLQGWIDEELERGQNYMRWQTRAAEHAQGTSELLSGADLARALAWWNPGQGPSDGWQPDTAWATRYHLPIVAMPVAQALEQLRAFIEASRNQAEAEKQRLLAQAQLERRRALGAIILATVALVAAIISFFSMSEADSARAQAKTDAANAESQRQIAVTAQGQLQTTLKTVKEQKALLGESVALLQAAKKTVESSLTEAKQAQHERTVSLFESQLTHASLAAKSEDYAEAGRVLQNSRALDSNIPPERRHARNLLAGHVATMGGAADKVYLAEGKPLPLLVGGVAVSPDGRILAVAGERATLVLYDAASSAVLQRLRGHDPKAGFTGAVTGIGFSHDGRYLYSGGEDGRVIRWTVLSGEQSIIRQDQMGRIWGLAIRPDGLQLATTDQQGTVTLWDMEKGIRQKQLKRPGKLDSRKDTNTDSPHALAYTEDGSKLVNVSYDRNAYVWDTATGNSLCVLKGHAAAVLAAQFSPDGKLLTTSGADNRIVLWDVDSCKHIREFSGHRNPISSLRFNATGTVLYSASEDLTLRAWDVDSGAPLQVFQGHLAGLTSVTLAPAQQETREAYAYTVSYDGTVRRWPLLSSERRSWTWATADKQAATSAAIAPDGHWAVVGLADGRLRLHALPGGELLGEVVQAHSSAVARIAFTPDGRTLATGSHDHTAKLWTVASGTDGHPHLTLRHTIQEHQDTVHAVSFSPDGQRLATASYDGRIGLFDTRTGQGRTVKAHDGLALSVSFDASGRRLLSSGKDYTLRLWESEHLDHAPQVLAQLQDSPMWASLAPDGRNAAVVGRELAITLLDLSQPQATAQRLVGHENTVYRAIYSTDGQQLATVSMDMTLRLWDVPRRRLLFTQKLPAMWPEGQQSPLWDFDFRCIPETGECWALVPLTMGRVVVYRWPYEHFPKP